MTKDLANIEDTRRAIDDLTKDIAKLTRMYDQLNIYSGTEDIDIKFAGAYAERMYQALTDQKQLKDLLRKHLKAMGGR